MKKLSLIAGIVFFVLAAKASQDSSAIIRRTSVYIEVLGSGLNNFYLLNVEQRIIAKKTVTLNFRLGLSLLDEYAVYPAINSPFGGRNSKMEIGFGVLFKDGPKSDGGYNYNQTLIGYNPTVGYRFEKNRILFRVTYTPFYVITTPRNLPPPLSHFEVRKYMIPALFGASVGFNL